MSETASASTATEVDRLSFPETFVWGSATSSYQIEGAHDADGRVPSIWDTFCATPGKVADQSNGNVACDHYNRYRDDVALMDELGLQAYRFSIAWPRIISDLNGTVNEAGLDFYDRLVDELLARDIRPFPTLYHWDLPQYLEDENGWVNRDTAYRFAEYAQAVVGRLGDRIGTFTTLNEPFVSANHGYLTGEHAPGRTSVPDSFAASHHLLLAHGLAGDVIRAEAPDAKLAIVLNFTPVDTATDSSADRAVARQKDDLENRWYADPIGGFGYPEETAQAFEWNQSEVLDGDLELIAQPIDVLGVNFYTRTVVSTDGISLPEDTPRNTMGWEIHPPSLGKLMRWLDDRYSFPAIMVTENGCPMPDTIRDDERILDDDRVDYIRGHLAQLHAAITDGVPIEGYFVWSLFDNFEWAWGYGPTFGIIEVDYETQKRTPKKSALWFSKAARTGGFSI